MLQPSYVFCEEIPHKRLPMAANGAPRAPDRWRLARTKLGRPLRVATMCSGTESPVLARSPQFTYLIHLPGSPPGLFKGIPDVGREVLRAPMAANKIRLI